MGNKVATTFAYVIHMFANTSQCPDQAIKSCSNEREGHDKQTANSWEQACRDSQNDAVLHSMVIVLKVMVPDGIA